MFYFGISQTFYIKILFHREVTYLDKKKAKEFLRELDKLQEKYGFTLTPTYHEEIDYTYDEESYVSGVSSSLLLIDNEGYEIDVGDLHNGYYTCYYCGRQVDEDSNFCNAGCEHKYNIRRNKSV